MNKAHRQLNGENAEAVHVVTSLRGHRIAEGKDLGGGILTDILMAGRQGETAEKTEIFTIKGYQTAYDDSVPIPREWR